MKKARVITGYYRESEDGINTKARAIIKGCTDNEHFEFEADELSILVTKQAAYSGSLVDSKSGNYVSIENKKINYKALAKAMHGICSVINLQQTGNVVALLSSGAKLTKDSIYQLKSQYPAPDSIKADAGNSIDELNLQIPKIESLNDHGSVFAITEFEAASDDIENKG